MRWVLVVCFAKLQPDLAQQRDAEFADGIQKVKNLEASIHDEAGRFVAQQGATRHSLSKESAGVGADFAPSSFAQTSGSRTWANPRAQDGFGAIAQKIKDLQAKMKSDLSTYDGHMAGLLETKAAPSSFLQSHGHDTIFASLQEKLKKLNDKMQADKAAIKSAESRLASEGQDGVFDVPRESSFVQTKDALPDNFRAKINALEAKMNAQAAAIMAKAQRTSTASLLEKKIKEIKGKMALSPGLEKVLGNIEAQKDQIEHNKRIYEQIGRHQKIDDEANERRDRTLWDTYGWKKHPRDWPQDPKAEEEEAEEAAEDDKYPKVPEKFKHHKKSPAPSADDAAPAADDSAPASSFLQTGPAEFEAEAQKKLAAAAKAHEKLLKAEDVMEQDVQSRQLQQLQADATHGLSKSGLGASFAQRTGREYDGEFDVDDLEGNSVAIGMDALNGLKDTDPMSNFLDHSHDDAQQALGLDSATGDIDAWEDDTNDLAKPALMGQSLFPESRDDSFADPALHGSFNPDLPTSYLQTKGSRAHMRVQADGRM